MAEVKWIKIVTDIFDDEKILLIETLPEADSIIVIWFKLLCLAGKQNNKGVFMMNDKIPYTEKMLATIFRRKETTIQLALQTFENFGMIEIVNGVITIPNWSKHQNFDKIEKNNEYMRNYMREYRSKQKLLTQNNKLCENGLPVQEWVEVLKHFNHECAYCGKTGDLEQEHIIPVNEGGKYVLGNIVPACRNCNASKGDKNMYEWYKNADVFNEERLEKIQEYCVRFNVNINVSPLRKTNVSGLDKNRIDKNRIEKNIKEKKDTSKHKHGEYKHVLLTDNEYKKLEEQYGSSNLQTIITYLDEYLEMKGTKYKSHYMVIKKWGAEAALKKEREQTASFFKSFLES